MIFVSIRHSTTYQSVHALDFLLANGLEFLHVWSANIGHIIIYGII